MFVVHLSQVGSYSLFGVFDANDGVKTSLKYQHMLYYEKLHFHLG